MGIVALRFLSVIPNATIEHIDRQRELLTALTRTVQHPGIVATHLLVRSVTEARAMLSAHAYALPGTVTLRELGRWPLNSDLVEYASTALRGQLVLASNDDVYPEGDAWLLPPPTALMLSRWAKRVETCDGCARRECNAVARTPANSVCSRANVGSFDAWLHRFDAPVTAETQPAALAMLRTPRHSFGADNLLGHVFEEHLRVPLRNRCHDYRLYHLHCRLTTSDAPNGRSSGSRRGYGEGFKTGRHNHGDMARLVMRHDPEQHSWDEARKIVRKRWPPE